MNTVDAASAIANRVRDMDSTARAVIAGIKQMCQDPAFQNVNKPVRQAVIDHVMRLESIIDGKI